MATSERDSAEAGSGASGEERREAAGGPDPAPATSVPDHERATGQLSGAAAEEQHTPPDGIFARAKQSARAAAKTAGAIRGPMAHREADTDPLPNFVPIAPADLPQVAGAPPAPPAGSVDDPQKSARGDTHEGDSRPAFSAESIEDLLGAIPDRGPQRKPAHAQSDGKDSASYHGEHSIPAALTSKDEEQKVVVSRQPLARTMKIMRLPGGKRARAKPKPTDVAGRSVRGVGWRVTLALLAALAVVAALFVVMGREAKGPAEASSVERASALRPTSIAPAMGPPSASGTGIVVGSARPEQHTAAEALIAATPGPTATAPEESTTTPVGRADVPEASTSRTGSPNRTAAPKPKPSAAGTGPETPTTAASGDLGEFKTSFH